VALPIAFPAETVRVAGIESRAELEFSETVVSAETACDSVIKHVMLAPDITPAALQVTRDTSTGARRPIVAVCELLRGVAATVALRLLAIEAAIVTGPAPALTERSTSAGAAQGADPETDEQLMEVAAPAVLSHKSIST
jgi:hypothetical protein